MPSLPSTNLFANRVLHWTSHWRSLNMMGYHFQCFFFPIGCALFWFLIGSNCQFYFLLYMVDRLFHFKLHWSFTLIFPFSSLTSSCQENWQLAQICRSGRQEWGTRPTWTFLATVSCVETGARDIRVRAYKWPSFITYVANDDSWGRGKR